MANASAESLSGEATLMSNPVPRKNNSTQRTRRRQIASTNRRNFGLRTNASRKKTKTQSSQGCGIAAAG